MSSEDLRARMQEYGVDELDVAAGIKCDPVTIKRILEGETKPRRMTVAALERFFQERPKPKPARKVANGQT